MRSIVLHTNDDACFEARFQAALDIAKAFGAHITCVQALQFDAMVPGDMYGMGAAELFPILRDNAEKFQRQIEARLADEGVAWDWVQDLDTPGQTLLAHAALADLIVLDTSEPPAGLGPSSIAGQVAIHSRTPVLAVPAALRRFDATAPALVAWNGSVESSHALRAAVPLLRRAASVQLITVEHPAEKRRFDLPPTEGAEFLSRHGIECTMVAIPLLGGDVGDAVRAAAEVRKVGYIVMGAYGHTRLREMVFGGATRSLLSNPPCPLLLSH